MKDETFDLILDSLSAEIYMTKRVLRHKTRLSLSAVDNAIEILIEDGDIEKIFVKNGIGTGRAEAAYRRIDA